jgi:hypothetical protein
VQRSTAVVAAVVVKDIQMVEDIQMEGCRCGTTGRAAVAPFEAMVEREQVATAFITAAPLAVTTAVKDL